MKLTEAEKAQIQAQRDKEAAYAKKLYDARMYLNHLPDETVLRLAAFQRAGEALGKHLCSCSRCDDYGYCETGEKLSKAALKYP
jgi:hypothetical protein